MVSPHPDIRSSLRTLELLAPARNLKCGVEAIRHGADAVYIGADHFGARAAAGNSLADIAELCRYAHRFLAKVYVTVNTLIYDDELADTQQLITDLAKANVDGLLVQDMSTLAMHRVALDRVGQAPALHASTQCDTRTAEKVAWLQALGFKRAVLARELSLDDISAIHAAVPDMELEVFVHGALCVSLSGLCYASEACLGRSANRGECAQMCRMKYDLLDADGHEIAHQRHLLSLKDNCQINHLEELAQAGACSFKIEGRLKGVDYVKNVVAAYNLQLNALVEQHPDRYARTSLGRVSYTFTPDLKKTFNRGFTTFFLYGRQPNIASFDTPKALGEMVGRVKEIRPDSFNVASTATFANGDGLCFINENRELEGFRVNRAVGNRLYPLMMPRSLKPHTVLYRTNAEAFSKRLSGQTAERRIPVCLCFSASAEGFTVTATIRDASGEELITCHSDIAFDHQPAKKPQAENIRKQLTKLGETDFVCDSIHVDTDAAALFIPSSLLSELRRNVTEALKGALAAQQKLMLQAGCHVPEAPSEAASTTKIWQPNYHRYSYTHNIANHEARRFYEQHALTHADDAFEVARPQGEKLLMQCRHCLRYSLGCCVKYGGQKSTWHEPLQLRLGDGRRFTLRFNCNECQMEVITH